MVKTHTTLTIDPQLLEEAKKSQINISELLESAIKKKLFPEIKDFPDQNLSVKCSLCHTEITEGYWCDERQIVLCSKCQENYDYRLCPRNKLGEHHHVKWPSTALQKPRK